MTNNKTLTTLMILAITVFGIHIFYIKTDGSRVDFTADGLYSLTEGTDQIIDKMKSEAVKPIEVKLYFSATTGKTLPSFIKDFITYADYVRNLLKEYEKAADGKIRVTVIDPKPDSDQEEDAGDYGLDGKPINQHGDKFFFGLVFESQTGSKDVVDFLWPQKQETIEYEISKKIYGLVWPKKEKIGVISSLEPLPENNPYMMQMLRAQGKQPGEPWSVMKVLEESYEVEKIGDVETISHDDFSLVVVIHPKSLSDKTLWALNEWVVTGGDTMIFMDNYAIEDAPPNNPQQPWAQLQYKRAAELNKLLNTWGISVPEDRFAADYAMAVKQATGQGGGASKMVTYLQINEKNRAETLNAESPIFQGLNDIRFYMAGVLEIADDAPGEITELITTTGKGDRLEIKPGFGENGLAYTDLNDPNKMLDAYRENKKQVLACLITGKLPSAFPDGASFAKETPQTPPGMPPGFKMPPAEDAEMITKEALSEDRFAEARVMVFSDVDMITNTLAFQQSFFGTQPVGDNYKVMLNGVDFLAGAKELMNVRSKQNIRRPFTVFDEIEAQADQAVLKEESQIRGEIEAVQAQLREKQQGISQKDAVLFQSALAEEIAGLNEKIDAGNKRLRQISKEKRASLEGAQGRVRVLIVWLSPVLVALAGLILLLSRRSKQMKGVS